MSRIRSVSEMERLARPLAEMKAGCRLRHQPRGVFGRPDYANKRRRIAVFVHGCFWHSCPLHGSIPKSNRAFWRAKFRKNASRHEEVRRWLKKRGWKVVVLWEHETRRSSTRASRGSGTTE